MSGAQTAFDNLVEDYPNYIAFSHWTPILLETTNIRDAMDWLVGEGKIRGIKDHLRTWMCPIGDLFLFEDKRLAFEVKLRFG